jgi:hypothetical protein
MRYRLRRFVLLCFAVLFVAISFSGCQSSDASDGTLDYSAIERSRFEYDGSTNTTKVTWSATLANNSIYDFKQISVKFNLYRNSELIKTETYQYEVEVKHGDDYTGNFDFIESGKIDKIEFVSWSAEHTTFGETYHLWILFSIIAVIVGTLAYGIYIFAFDGDFSDIWDVLWVPIVVIVLFGGGLSTVLGWMSSHWVNVVIVLCAIFVFVIFALILHLMRFFIFGEDDVFDDMDRAEIAPIIKKYLQPGDSENFKRALEIVILDRKVSTSYLQRRLKIGYNTAADITQTLEDRGIIGPDAGSGKKRDILIFDGMSINQS